MSEPCPCWHNHFTHSRDVHCCFRAGVLEDYPMGGPIPCGHDQPEEQ